MAISKGKESIEFSRKLYTGYASAYIIAVNPSKKELEKLIGKPVEKEPEYVSTVVDKDGNQIPQVRLDFICKPDPKKYIDIQGNPVDTILHLTLFLKKQYKYGANSDKYQIIDNYGRTAWATKEEIANKQIPIYQMSDGTKPANIDKNYKPAYEGLEDLTKIIRAYLCIPGIEKWENGKVVGIIDNPSDAEVMPDHLEDYFKGDFSELKEILNYQPNNKVQILCGVKTTDDNKQYQTVYPKMVLRNNIKDAGNRFEEAIKSIKNNDGMSNMEFDFTEFHEYTIIPSSFNSEKQMETPDFNTPSFEGVSPWDIK